MIQNYYCAWHQGYAAYLKKPLEYSETKEERERLENLPCSCGLPLWDVSQENPAIQEPKRVEFPEWGTWNI